MRIEKRPYGGSWSQECGASRENCNQLTSWKIFQVTLNFPYWLRLAFWEMCPALEFIKPRSRMFASQLLATELYICPLEHTFYFGCLNIKFNNCLFQSLTCYKMSTLLSPLLNFDQFSPPLSMCWGVGQWVGGCTHGPSECSASGSQRRASDCLKQMLQVVMSHFIWVLGTNLFSSGREVHALNC